MDTNTTAVSRYELETALSSAIQADDYHPEQVERTGLPKPERILSVFDMVGHIVLPTSMKKKRKSDHRK